MPGTELWADREGYDAEAARMVAGLHSFLDHELAASVEHRQRHWDRDYSSPEAYARSVEPNRRRLERIIGAVDRRVEPVGVEYVSGPNLPAMVAESDHIAVYAVRWDVYGDVKAEGLLLKPKGDVRANVVAMADCDVNPEQYAGLAPGLEPTAQVARLLAEAGCRVLVPTLLNRSCRFSGNPDVSMTNLTHREWIWRQAFETGRHPIGYEVDEVRAAIDWFTREGQPLCPVGVVGHGEGGLIALMAAALDTRIDAAWVAGYYGTMRDCWRQPIARDVWGLLDEFGDAEVASLIVPRSLLVEPCLGPAVAGPPEAVNGRSLAASGRLIPQTLDSAVDEFNRLLALTDRLERRSLAIAPVGGEARHNAGDAVRRRFLDLLHGTADGRPGTDLEEPAPVTSWTSIRTLPDPTDRMGRMVRQLQDHTQALIRTSELRRYEAWEETDPTSVESWTESTKPYRERFWEEVIGKFPPASEPLKARTVPILDEPNYVGYAVKLPVWPDVVASGVLLLPKDLKEGETRPVVVCQHGLEGTPEPIVDRAVESVYHAYGAHLADRGYIVYAPQNPYKGQDAFRTLQRKAHPLKKSLFAIIVRQHERTLEWLKTLPHVDPDRIAFYGLSYGGKTAMRVPALLPDYCLSICSADFNEWVVKCTNLNRSYSYLFTVEYDMYEWDLASGFNYAELAGLIAPRPFQVERGHSDGVAPDEWIGYEFAKVRRTYDSLGLSDRCDITYFDGPHEIRGDATFRFLAEHLDWPQGAEPLEPAK